MTSRPCTRPLFLGFLTLALSLGLAQAAAAQTHTLTGIVYGDGTPLGNTLVEALQNGTTVTVAQSTTTSAGRYTLSLAAGTYDLRVTPSAAGFSAEVVQDVEVQVNREYDVILLKASGTVSATVSGTVRGLGGQAIANTGVYAYTATGQFITSASTNASGQYSLVVSAPTIRLSFHSGSTSAVAPNSFSYYRYAVAVSGSTTVDLNLPVVQVSGQVTTASGSAVSGATVESSSSRSYDSSTQSEWYASHSTTSNASGAYSVLLLTGTGAFNVRPPSGSASSILNVTNVGLTGDLVRNFALPSGVTVSGTVRGLAGQAVANTWVNAYNANGQFVSSAPTNASGQYSLAVPTGTIRLYLYPGSSSPAAPSSFNYYRYGIAVTGPMTLDVTLPVVQVSGQVTDTAGGVVAGATVQGSSSRSYDSTTQTEWYASQSTTANASGSYSLLLLTGTGSFTIRPPSGSSSALSTVSNVALTGDLVRNFALPASITVSGTVRGLGGQGVANAWVYAYDVNGNFLSNARANTNGQYSLTVPAGTIRLYTFSGGSSTVAPPSFNYYQYGVAVSGPTTVDLNLPVVRLNGTAADSNGTPVAGISIQTSTSRSFQSATQTEYYSNASISSNAAGTYSQLILSGTGTVSVVPPSSSGFSSATLNNVALNTNLTQRIVLQRPDTTPPVLVTKPVVVHLSDTSVSIGWTTNEASSSRVEFGLNDSGSLGSTVTRNTPTTSHSITLVDLQAQGVYSFRVSSTDPSGNVSPFSEIGFFRTQAPPGDITAPVITSGPTVAFVDQTTAIIQWTTDEPSNGLVEYAAGGLAGTVSESFGTFGVSHSVKVTGLQQSTTYSARVTMVDPDGNATSGSSFQFATKSAPDTQSPVIASGPTVKAVSDTRITVTWTTDEAATSAVSYNDGLVFNVTNDPTLTTEHTVTLAGLKPNTFYNVTVSSKDAVGNGPTLAPVLRISTASTADTTGPVLSGIAAAAAKTSVSLTWTTSEAATSEVAFGTLSGEPDGFYAGLTLTTSHNVALTGLISGTTYYVVLSSVDAAGNRTSSNEMTFTTVAGHVNVPPTAPGPFTVSENPNRTGSFVITWGAASDDGPGGIVTYEVFRNRASVAILPGSATSYQETGLPEGQYDYTVTATDAESLAATSETLVVIVDQTVPTVNLPADISVPASSAVDAIVSYIVTASDARDPRPAVSCSPTSGGAFPIGVTVVSCSATDAAGNIGTGSFRVTVTDPFKPVLTVPGRRTVETSDPAGAVVAFSASATDNSDPNPTVTCTPASGSLFAPGTTVVSCEARDASGNSATGTFEIVVTVVVPVLRLDTAALSFGAQHVNTASAPRSVTITNAGGASLVISGISAPAHFAVTGCPGGSIAAGGTCALSVTFRPLAVGPLGGAIGIASNAAGSPHTVAVSGEGINSAPVADNLDTSTIKNTAVSGTLAATDADNDPVTFAQGATAPVNGTVQIDPATGSFTYTPAHNVIGTGSFTFVAVDSVGAMSAEATVTITINAETTTGTVPAGGTVTTDPDGTGAIETDPIETSVMSPSGGDVSVTEQAIKGKVTDGYSFLGQQVLITAPPATAANPLVLTFYVDASLVPKHDNENTVRIFRNRVVVPNCPDPSGITSEDPCVSVRERLSGGDSEGDLRFVVLTSMASEWHFGVSTLNEAPIAADDAYTSSTLALTVPGAGLLGNDRDPDGHTLTVAVVAGPQRGTLVLDAAGGFTYTADSSYSGPVTFTYAAFDGKVTSNVATVTISVAIPTTTTLQSSAASPLEGQSVTFTATVASTDPAVGLLSGVVAFYDGDSLLAEVTLSAGVAQFETATLQSGAHSISARFAGAGIVQPSSGALAQNIVNVAPTVGAISWTAFEPVKVGTSITGTASFSDPGITDTHTAVWIWGDGTTSAGTITKSGTANSVTGAHAYSAPGLYTVTLTVTDSDGAPGQALFRHVVVYSPTAGYVTTGGGAIASPAGAYPANPSLTGTATFTSLGARYLSGATTPTGTTRFTFSAASLTLNSSSYSWLVVSGPRAWARGSGIVTIAGVNHPCQFLWSVVDGQATGGGGVDRFRLKIWKTADGAVVYDNGFGAPVDAVATQAVTTTGTSVMIVK